jgi:hypothetical protein
VHDDVGRLLSTTLLDPQSTTINAHQYEYDMGSQRTQQVFTEGNFVNYTYDNIGQLKTALGAEPDGIGGQIPRLHEQFGYAYDAAWNLNYRTNNQLVQSFGVNNLNELTTGGRSGTLTVAGTATERRARKGSTRRLVPADTPQWGGLGLFFDGLPCLSWGGFPETHGTMPRVTRVELPGAIYHVMDRGDRPCQCRCSLLTLIHR